MVLAIRNVPSSLRISKPTAARSAPERTCRQVRSAPGQAGEQDREEHGVDEQRQGHGQRPSAPRRRPCGPRGRPGRGRTPSRQVASELTTIEASTAPPSSSSTRMSTSFFFRNGSGSSRVPKTRRRPSRSASTQPSPAYSRPSRPSRPAPALASTMSSMLIWFGPVPIRPGKASSTGVGDRRLRLGVPDADVADQREREGQQREERQEAEVGDRTGDLAAEHLAVPVVRPHRVVERRPAGCARRAAVPSPGPRPSCRRLCPPSTRVATRSADRAGAGRAGSRAAGARPRPGRARRGSARARRARPPPPPP